MLSGKGGTGKSSFTAAFASFQSPVVVADCDVEAADLFLLFQPQEQQSYPFLGRPRAHILRARCIQCGQCVEACRFRAIENTDQGPVVKLTSCEGCGLCARMCPEQAIEMASTGGSYWHTGESRFGPLIYGQLGIGEEMSGKLVAKLREKADEVALQNKSEMILVDGPPGIGCPVIASITGNDLAVLVTEPSRSGLSDLKRVLQLSRSFRIPVAVIINKCDLNPDMGDQIQHFCTQEKIPVIGQVPFDWAFAKAMERQLSVPEYAPTSPITQQMMGIWQGIMKLL